MKKSRIKTSLLVSASAIAGVAMGAGIALAVHPPVTLYTYEEVAQQMGFPVAPVMVDRVSKQGMPYSPKQTCGLGGCHDGTTVQNGATVSSKYYGKALKSYSDLADHAFHATLGYNEWMDNDPNGLFVGDGSSGGAPTGRQTGLAANKPWVQSHGHNGKW